MSWDIPIGTEFAGYRILGILGRGGMSVVYAAEHIRLGRMVALKLLTPALAADESFRERFMRESRLAATLDHPNIIPIYDAGEAEGFLYIAMRHVEGPDLGEVLKETGQLPIGQTLFYIEQVAGALDQAHEQGLVHRDVKPANILIAKPSDRVYLTDFGVVKATSSGGLTKTGYFLGTFAYAAPEQIEGKEVDGRTDLYALGCVVYESLSGEPPFLAETEASVIHAHLVEPPPKLTTKRPDLPLAINDIIATAMAKAKEDRFSSAGELVRALRAVALGTGVTRHGSGIPAGAAAPETVHATLEGPSPAPWVGQTGGAPPTELPPSGAPAAPPPPPPRGPRTFTLSGRQLAIAAVVLLLIIGGAAAAAVLASGGGSKKSAATSTEMAMHTTTGTSSGGLLAELPGDVPTDKCIQSNGEHAGAIQTVNCDYAIKGTRILLHVDSFKSKKSLYSSYKAHGVAEEKLAGGHPDETLMKSTGTCSSIGWLGEGTWSHSGMSMSESAGHRSCFLVSGSNKLCKPTKVGACSVIVWTLDESKLFMRAVYPTTRHTNLFHWWRFHSHLFG